MVGLRSTMLAAFCRPLAFALIVLIGVRRGDDMVGYGDCSDGAPTTAPPAPAPTTGE